MPGKIAGLEVAESIAEGEFLKRSGTGLVGAVVTGGEAAWGSIGGTLSAQVDLSLVLAGKSDAGHGHGSVYAPLSHDHSGVYDPAGTASAAISAHLSALNHALLHSNSLDHSSSLDHSNALDHARLHVVTAVADHTFPGGTTTFLRADGTFATPPGGSSPLGVLSDLQISVLQSDGTLNAASGVQTWAGTNKTAQDVFTVEANTTYRVRGRWIVNTGATTHTTAMAWALNGATVASFEYLVMLWAAAANAIATAQSTTHVSGVASKVLNATGTLVYTIIQFEGIITFTLGGTITPQINFSANPTGTNLMKRGSWISFEKIGADTFVEAGGWA